MGMTNCGAASRNDNRCASTAFTLIPFHWALSRPRVPGFGAQQLKLAHHHGFGGHLLVVWRIAVLGDPVSDTGTPGGVNRTLQQPVGRQAGQKLAVYSACTGLEPSRFSSGWFWLRPSVSGHSRPASHVPAAGRYLGPEHGGAVVDKPGDVVPGGVWEPVVGPVLGGAAVRCWGLDRHTHAVKEEGTG